MLVMSRERGEKVIIPIGGGRQIVVTVCDIRAGRTPYKVRLGFDAPDDIPINREEIHESKFGKAHGISEASA